MPDADDTVEWLIVGGGAAGLACGLALTGQLNNQELTDRPIVLLDAHRIGHGSSWHNPGRGQGGFHYPDRRTSEDLQDLLVHNLTRYPQWFADHLSRTPAGELQRSWYAVLSDDASAGKPWSIIPNHETVESFEYLSCRWDQLRQQNPQLGLLGEGPFMEWVDPAEAAATMGTDQYVRVARTLEPSLDVAPFIDGLRDAVTADPRVSTLEHDQVLGIERLENDPTGARFLVRTLHDGEMINIRTRNLNICAWEATEELLAPLGYQFGTLNRIKRAFVLDLGEGSRHFPSTIAVFGPHIMVRNFYDGKAYCTVANVSNVLKERVPDVDARLTDLITHKHDDQHLLRDQVRAALDYYYPGLEVTNISDPEYGVVKVFSESGKIDLLDPMGDQNSRLVNGFSNEVGEGLWVTWSMKLVSCFAAAEQFHASVLSGS